MSVNGSRRWAWPSELAQAGILGINRRNLALIMGHNQRKDFPRVDDKLLTKKICRRNGIPVPETYAVLRRHADVHQFRKWIGDRSDFVVKPAGGAAGRGILVICQRQGNTFITSSGRKIPWSELRHHLSSTMSGLYSLGGQPDAAIIEQRIVTHPALQKVVVGGTPDIRIILYRGVPTMAMLRLPTEQSSGRANLHQGAVAVAINLVDGKSLGGAYNNRMITHHPDTHEPLAGLTIPDWPQVLDASMKLSDVLKLGYLGVDFVIDANDGAVVLEANARPGLAIQVAHHSGLLKRLQWLEPMQLEGLSIERRRELAAELAAMN